MRGRCGTAADCRRYGQLLHVEKKYFRHDGKNKSATQQIMFKTLGGN